MYSQLSKCFRKKKRNRSDDFQPKTHWILGQSSKKRTPWSAEQFVWGFGCFSQLKISFVAWQRRPPRNFGWHFNISDHLWAFSMGFPCISLITAQNVVFNVCCFVLFFDVLWPLWAALGYVFEHEQFIHINTATLAAKNSGCQDQLAYHSQGRNMTELSVGAHCFFTYTLGDLVGTILKNRSFFHQFNRGWKTLPPLSFLPLNFRNYSGPGGWGARMSWKMAGKLGIPNPSRTGEIEWDLPWGREAWTWIYQWRPFCSFGGIKTEKCWKMGKLGAKKSSIFRGKNRAKKTDGVIFNTLRLHRNESTVSYGTSWDKRSCTGLGGKLKTACFGRSSKWHHFLKGSGNF